MTRCHQVKLIFCAVVLAAGLFGSSLAAASDAPRAGDVAKGKVVWAQFEAWLDSYTRGDLDQVMNIFADGNLAFVRATWELVTVSSDGKSEAKERNRALDILRAQDGRWVIFRSMNYPEG